MFLFYIQCKEKPNIFLDAHHNAQSLEGFFFFLIIVEGLLTLILYTSALDYRHLSGIQITLTSEKAETGLKKCAM